MRQNETTGAPVRSEPKLGNAWAWRPSLKAASESISADVTTPWPPRPWMRTWNMAQVSVAPGVRGIGCLFGRAAGKLLTRNVGRGGCAGAATARSSGPSNSRSLMSAVHTSATEAALRPFSDLARGDVDYAGGKGANLGELTGAGVPVPPGFVVGAPAYGAFCDEGGLRERIEERLHSIDVEDTAALEAASGDVRSMVESEPMPLALEAEIAAAYAELAGSDEDAPVAVRSSATAEDTASASFAGMNETFLNVRGADEVVAAVRHCWASLFGSRTVYYRAKRGFTHADMDIAVVVQAQIESTRAGVMFTIDPGSGRHDRIVIEGAFGLGESVVSGQVSPDRYVLDKETLAVVTRDVKRKELAIESVARGGTVTRELSGEESQRPVLHDDEVRRLGEMAVRIETHYGAPQDTEWAFDSTGELWMLQSRPVTSSGGTPVSDIPDGKPLVRGLGAAPGQASGPVRVIASLADAAGFAEGDVLVAHMTAPDWVPLMRRASGIVTDSGGMTCHAAIVSRELGVPCIVGTGDGTSKLRDGEIVTVDATHGAVLAGVSSAKPADTAGARTAAAPRPTTATKLLVNLSEPSQV